MANEQFGNVRLSLLLVSLCWASGLSGPVRAQPFLFDDVSATAGVNVVHRGPVASGVLRIGTGVVWFDYDNDGDLDLFVTMRKTGFANLLYENDGTGVFTDVAAARGVDFSASDAGGASSVDYDNDGDNDLYLANSDADILLRNNLIETGTPDFTDVTATAFPADPVPFIDARGSSISWGDYDADGFLDFYVSHHTFVGSDRFDYTADSQDRFYHNNGDGTFTDVKDLIRGVDDADGNDNLDGYGFIAGWTDYDNDGDADIFMTNDCPFGPLGNKIFRNDGGTDPLAWNFTEVISTTGLDASATCVNAMGLAMGDYNRDGLWDYFYTDIGSATLVRNDGGGLFTDVSVAAGVFDDTVPGSSPPQNRVTWGTVFLDYDLDGFQDLAVAAGTLGQFSSSNPQPNLLYHNEGDGTFTDQSDLAWAIDTRRGRTIALGDYDGDGDPDLFLVNYNEAVVLLNNNDASGNNWLQVLLQGSVSNRNGIGAKLHVTDSGGATQHYEVRSGSNLGSGDDMAAYFGFGNISADPLVHIEIDWPSGIQQAVDGVATNQRITIAEATTDLSVVVTPVNGPIVIGGSGGVFDYDLSLTNNTIQTKTFNAWIDITGPGVSITRGPVSTSHGAGVTMVKTLSQSVPGGAPDGTYTLTAKVGTFPVADATSSFTFEKNSLIGVGKIVTNWNSTLTPLQGGKKSRIAAARTELGASYTNPANLETVIPFTLADSRPITLRVFDMLGREVGRLDAGLRAAGRHQITFDSSRLSTGMYVYVLEAGTIRMQRKMLIIR